MIKYKCTETKSGKLMYFKNGKVCKEADVPEAILKNLDAGTELQMPSPNEDLENNETEETTTDEPKQPLAKVCIYCGEPSTRQRFINQEVIELCDTDYGTHTTGEIVQQLREVQSAKDAVA